MKIHQNVTGLILAGGQARRMGGTDKGLILLDGKPMISYVIDTLKSQVDSIIINANRNIDKYKEYGYPVISDEITNYQGPLAGMACGLTHCETEYIVTVPCDGPLLKKDYVDKLLESVIDANSKISVAFDGHRLQPVYALIHTDLLSDLNEFLDSGERKIDRWYEKHHFAKTDFSASPEMFTNINTPEDLETINQYI